MDIYNVAIAGHHINLIRAMRDSHIRHYVWEVAKVLIPVLLTGVTTFAITRSIDNRNKKRWMNDTFIKNQNDLIISINKILLDFFDKFDKYFNLLDNTPVKLISVHNFFNEYNDELQELRKLYYELVEVYDIEVKPLTKTLRELDYLKNYVEENIKSSPDKLTIIMQDNGANVSLQAYLSTLSMDFILARNAMIKTIQKKLK